MNDRDELILKDIRSLCVKLDDLTERLTIGFAGNSDEHNQIKERLHSIEMQATEDRSHTHPHCEDCITNTRDIRVLEDKISLRDKVAMVVVGAAGILKTIFWWKQ